MGRGRNPDEESVKGHMTQQQRLTIREGVGGRVTGDVDKGQRGNDRSIKEMNGSVGIKGNTERVIIRRESRAAGGGEGDASVSVVWGWVGHTHMQLFKVAQM